MAIALPAARSDPLSSGQQAKVRAWVPTCKRMMITDDLAGMPDCRNAVVITANRFLR